MSIPAKKPYHVVPVFAVTNVSTSTPEAVNVGAVPFVQSTDAGQSNVDAPPLVKINVKLAPPPGGTFEIEKLAEAINVPVTI